MRVLIVVNVDVVAVAATKIDETGPKHRSDDRSDDSIAAYTQQWLRVLIVINVDVVVAATKVEETWHKCRHRSEDRSEDRIAAYTL